MDQKKIGAFIAECRKEKKMTQEQLAEKLGVTDKAISKWENGRCLMDISMLKPLSECLGVSIIELINGERIDEDEIYLKTDETIKNTIDYSNNKIKEIIKSIVRVLLTVIIILLILFGIVVYKVICANDIYYVEMIENDEKLNEALSMNDKIDIYNKEIDNSEYLVLDNLKIRNDFKDFEGIEDNETVMYSKDDGSFEQAVWFGTMETYVDTFKTYSYNSSIGDTKERREEFLLDNNIDDDIDLFKYINENYYMENSWLDSISKMRDNYMVNDFVLNIIPYENDGMTIINGDYYGYIYNYSLKDELTCDIRFYRVVHILDNDRIYTITFMGDEYTADEYIKDILSTLVIQ